VYNMAHRLQGENEMQEDEGAPLLAEEGRGSKVQSDVGPAHPMTTLLEETYRVKQLKKGEILEGTIVHISPEEVLVDVGSKSEGLVTARELERLDPESRSELQVGEQILAYVLVPEDKNGNILLSLTRAQIEKDWREAQRLYETQEIFEGSVAGYNKGGLIVRLGQVRGFVPTSQLALSAGVPVSVEERKASLVGSAIQVKVIELDRARNRLILSERSAVRDWRRKQKEKLLAELNAGDVRVGVVSSLCDFGAFVDLGDADGLVHLSEISWRRVTHPSEVLSVGQEVDVYVLNVDRERKRIGLSVKRLTPDPWTVIDEQYRMGQLVEGTITKLVKFGAFARLADSDVEGLIHVSELSDEHINHPKEAVQEGDVLALRIIKIDSARRRMGLSLKRVDWADYAEQDWGSSYAEDTTAVKDDKSAAVEGIDVPETDQVSSLASESSDGGELPETEAIETVAGEKVV
jgi:small subunit ribosomal protein S1